MTELDPPSWLADPTGRHEHRYWDGEAWTEHVADDGVAATDPYDGEGPSAAGASSRDAGGPVPWTASAPPPAPPDAKLTWEPGTARPRADGDAPARTYPGGWASPDDILDALAPTPDPTPSAVAPLAPAPPADPVPPPPPVERPPLGAPVSTAAPPPAPPDDIPTPHARRRAVVLIVAVLAIVAAVVGVLALTGGSDDDRVGDVRAVLDGRVGEIDDDDVDCLAKAVVDELGDDGVDALELDERGEGQANLPPELIAALQVATSTCAVTFEPETDESTTSTTALPSVSDLAGQYRTRFPALTAPQAECLATADISLRSSQETYAPDEVYAQISACGVEPGALGLATTTTAAG